MSVIFPGTKTKEIQKPNLFIGSRDLFTWIILKIILCFVLTPKDKCPIRGGVRQSCVLDTRLLAAVLKCSIRNAIGQAGIDLMDGLHADGRRIPIAARRFGISFAAGIKIMFPMNRPIL